MSVFDEYPKGVKRRAGSVYREILPPSWGTVLLVRQGYTADVRLQTGEKLYRVPYPAGAVEGDGSGGDAHGRMGGIRTGARVLVQFVGGSFSNPAITDVYPSSMVTERRGNGSKFTSARPEVDDQSGNDFWDLHHSGYGVKYGDRSISIYNRTTEILQIDLSVPGGEKITVSKNGAASFEIDLAAATTSEAAVLGQKLNAALSALGDIISAVTVDPGSHAALPAVATAVNAWKATLPSILSGAVKIP